MKTFAWWVSLLLGPFVMIPVILEALVLTVANKENLFFTQIVVILFNMILPSIAFGWLLKTKQISDIDITKRKERIFIFCFFLAMNLLSMLCVGWGGERELEKILFLIWVLGFAAVTITFFWKISIHALVITAAWIVMMDLWGLNRTWWGILVVLLVLWSRLVQKKHTGAQLLAGMALPFLILGSGLFL